MARQKARSNKKSGAGNPTTSAGTYSIGPGAWSILFDGYIENLGKKTAESARLYQELNKLMLDKKQGTAYSSNIDMGLKRLRGHLETNRTAAGQLEGKAQNAINQMSKAGIDIAFRQEQLNRGIENYRLQSNNADSSRADSVAKSVTITRRGTSQPKESASPTSISKAPPMSTATPVPTPTPAVETTVITAGSVSVGTPALSPASPSSPITPPQPSVTSVPQTAVVPPASPSSPIIPTQLNVAPVPQPTVVPPASTLTTSVPVTPAPADTSTAPSRTQTPNPTPTRASTPLRYRPLPPQTPTPTPPPTHSSRLTPPASSMSFLSPPSSPPAASSSRAVVFASTPVVTEETRREIQYALREKARLSNGALTCQLSLPSSGNNHIGTLIQNPNRPSSSSNPIPTYEAHFYKTEHGRLQAKITTAAKDSQKVDENLKECLTDVLEVFQKADVPVVNLGGALVDSNNPELCTHTYEILRNAIESSDDEETPKPIPVLDRLSILMSLLFCYNYENENPGLNPISSLYIDRIMGNESLRDELYMNLTKKYPEGTGPSDAHPALTADLFKRLNILREKGEARQEDKGNSQSTMLSPSSAVTSRVTDLSTSPLLLAAIGKAAVPASPMTPATSTGASTLRPRNAPLSSNSSSFHRRATPSSRCATTVTLGGVVKHQHRALEQGKKDKPKI